MILDKQYLLYTNKHKIRLRVYICKYIDAFVICFLILMTYKPS